MKAKLTDEQMRIAIAEACGWKFEPQFGPLALSWRKPNVPAWDGNSWSGRAANPPDYLNSLDAMHEAEKAIPRHLWTEYTMQLRKVIQRECDTEEHYVLDCERSQLIADFWFYHATARQRAEAFIAVTRPHPATQEENKP